MKRLSKLLIPFLVFFVLLDVGLAGFYFYKFFGKESRPGSCLVLEEKYCLEGKPSYHEEEVIGLVFLLPKKAPIFAPFDGNFSPSTYNVQMDGEARQYSGIGLQSGDPNHEDGAMGFSAIFFDSKPTSYSESRDVKKGEILGYVSGKKVEFLGDYNLFISFSEFDYEQKVDISSEKLLREHFSTWEQD